MICLFTDVYRLLQVRTDQPTASPLPSSFREGSSGCRISGIGCCYCSLFKFMYPGMSKLWTTFHIIHSIPEFSDSLVKINTTKILKQWELTLLGGCPHTHPSTPNLETWHKGGMWQLSTDLHVRESECALLHRQRPVIPGATTRLAGSNCLQESSQ